MNNPLLSLGMICGDTGLLTLERCLRSVLVRPEGPGVDEIVIGFNGTDNATFHRIIEPVAHDVPVVVIHQTWEDDFAKARNEVFSNARGEWILTLDSDDHWSSLGDEVSPDGLPAYNAVCRQYGIPEISDGKGGTTLREFLRQLVWNVNVVAGVYDYLINPSGECEVRQQTRRVVRRSAGWVWEHKIHEALYLVGPSPEMSVFQPGLLIRHYPVITEQTRLGRNQRIIEVLEASGAQKDARHAFDLSAMHATQGVWEKVIDDLNQALNKAQNNDDVYFYRLCKVTAALSLGNTMLALQESVAAVATCPERQEGYWAAVDCCARLGNWQAVVHFFELGAVCKPVLGKVDYVVSRCVNPRVHAANAWCQLGEPEKGIPLAKEAARLVPSSEAAVRMIKQCQDEVKKKEVSDGVLQLVERLIAVRDHDTADRILTAAEESPALRELASSPKFQALERRIVPFVVGSSPTWLNEVAEDEGAVGAPATGPLEDAKGLIERFHGAGTQVIRYVERETADGVDRAVVFKSTRKEPIVFYCPMGAVPWDPNYPEAFGIGGSETAAIMLARELARRGYPVTMYCPGGQPIQPNAANGIVWYGLQAFNPKKLDGIVVACRAPFILRNPELQSPTWIWHQDNGYGAMFGNDWHWNRAIDERSQGSLHVSAWARAGLCKEIGIPPNGHHAVIGNGIPKEWVWERLKERPERNPHRVIYASDPTRGLDTLLNAWPHVKKAAPDAELHVYCDFDASLKIAAHISTVGTGKTVPGIVELFKRVKALDADRSTTGVNFHGRVPQPVLARALFASSVYAYPGGMMPEGFGVSLVQAAAAGCAVVYPHDGALPEVLPDRVYEVSGPAVTEAAAQEFMERLIEAVEHPSAVNRELVSAEAWERHGWPIVADRFIAAVEL